jgi:hypothetical protein
MSFDNLKWAAARSGEREIERAAEQSEVMPTVAPIGSARWCEDGWTGTFHQDLSDCTLIVASDFPSFSHEETDFFGLPLLSHTWYWAWEEAVWSEVEQELRPFLHIESGPVSPLTLEEK